MVNLEISFTVLKEHINQIQEWITSDQSVLKDGLLSNWNYIHEGFSQNRAAIALLDSNAVGFAIWKPHEAETTALIFYRLSQMRENWAQAVYW